jgi:hypothetical protein
VRPAVPKSRLEKDGGRADVVADSGDASSRGEGEGSARVPRKELSSALVRILKGTSSRMVENVRRWLIRLSSCQYQEINLLHKSKLP